MINNMVLHELSQLEELTTAINTAKQNNKLMIVDCYAPWCKPCKELGPVLLELSNEMNNIVIYKVDTDEADEFIDHFDIIGLPTLKLYHKGVNVETIVGSRSKTQLVELFNKYLNKSDNVVMCEEVVKSNK